MSPDLPDLLVFAKLMADHARLAAVSTRSRQRKADVFRALLGEFALIQEVSAQDEAQQAAANRHELQGVIDEYTLALEEWREHQVYTADEFNLMEVLELGQKETRHSMMLAWLLDHDMLRLGTHAQGRVGFRLFLDALKLPLEWADKPYWVRREVSGDNSRVDIEVAARGEFLIHIENKIWSKEGQRQTHREGADMRSRAEALGVASGRYIGLFLTPDRAAPRNKDFIAISWVQIAQVVEKFADKALAPEVKLFASHYAKALHRFILKDSQEEEGDRGQDAVQRGRALSHRELAQGTSA